MSEVILRHCFTLFHSLGGVQAILRRHLAKDQTCNILSRFIIFFEASQPGWPRVQGLGLTWRHSIHTARLRLRAALSDRPPVIFVYHNFWGLPFFADLDQAHRRLGFLHSTPADMKGYLPRLDGLVDGILCVSRPQ